MITREDIQHAKDVSRKQFPRFYKEVDEHHAKVGTPKSVRRHKSKELAIKNKSRVSEEGEHAADNLSKSKSKNVAKSRVNADE